MSGGSRRPRLVAALVGLALRAFADRRRDFGQAF
jgi:hypothetical protein